ncbi:ATP-binding cassette domain-containing protein [Clostridium sp. 'deep sea']|uniref:phosphate ABC transporter ATP-binding protein n=1 Tax=Clostridium sp. 'deep sea' TaxID=2779445 RepID=UPI0018967234|nr:ATP-binding cassette domain-containing protein [Clostridium sp. 'deep sea']QOR35136.1 ATP-binding cassette domain-containing protein [Clostridium sp. 'deep sea']
MVIKVNNLTSSYNNKVVLKDVSCTFHKNKITSIIGPSGCGKTTLLLTLAGLVKHIAHYHMQGSIIYNNNNYNESNISDLIGKTGFVFQQPMAFPLSIIKNLTYATKYLGKSKSEREKIAIAKLKEVNLYNEVKQNLNLKANNLSGGQQQRLCIARALTTNPSVLLLDEPCSALDVKNTAIIESLLLRLKEKYSIILVTHNLAQAKRISDDTLFFNEAQLIEANDTYNLFNNPKNKKTQDYLNGDFG